MKNRRIPLSVAGLLLLTVALTGCMETRYHIRQIDQHPSGQFNTLETSSEEVIMVGPLTARSDHSAINFWKCRQDDRHVECARVCDESWDRICWPYLSYEFGRITPPRGGQSTVRVRSGDAPQTPVEEPGDQRPRLDAPDGDDEAPAEEGVEEPESTDDGVGEDGRPRLDRPTREEAQ